MCLGIPGELLSRREQDGVPMGVVRFAGVTREACLACRPDVVPGDWVLVHVGMVIARIDRAEAERAYALLEGMGQTEELSTPSP